MREIIFRGRKSNGEWFYGDLVTVEKTDGRPSRKEILPFDAVLFENTKEVEEDTIGQFTGLHDKNGKEIYEGDIVANDFCNNIVDMTVEWCAAGFWALHEIDGDDTMHFVVDYLNEIEVIGNIHDTPELLNK